MSKILLIDDDNQINEVVKTSLEMLGHAVVTVDQAAHASEASRSVMPDITLVDYVMPGCSGLELLEQLRSEKPDRVHFLATGMADFHLLKQALRAGASSMLSKPYRITDLMELIDLAMLLEQSVQAESEPPVDMPEILSLICPSGPSIKAEDLAQLVQFARIHGTDPLIAGHNLPLIAVSLMKNAGIHGSTTDDSTYSVEMTDIGEKLRLTVVNSGPKFDWRKQLSRAQSIMEKSRASGLQIVLALADRFEYEDDGRIAKVCLRKRRTAA
ncbi:MAG: response regulator [Calditrichota bacterium]